ncbi:MAG: OB-fold nucleic acid binding domain-containing protein [Candidatus Thorarchaeota archaeon]
MRVGSSNVEVEGTIIRISEIRTVNTKFGKRNVATAVLEDDSGRIDLTLWEDQIEMVKEGQNIKITGGYVTEWNGNLQLNVRKGGRIAAL